MMVQHGGEANCSPLSVRFNDVVAIWREDGIAEEDST
jgi:hypothetical protein